MKAEIITVGNELILGDTLNTNAYYLSRRLAEIGIDVLFHTSVKDEPKMLSDVINIALSRVDLLIFTGGLGPTYDDMTKEVISETLGLDLKLDKTIENSIRNYFDKNNRAMSLNNIKQAYIPENSQYIPNEIGTAPGIYINWNSKILILLPGPPQEMKLMFDKYVISLIKQDFIIVEKTLKVIDIGEAQVESTLKDIIINQKDVNIATYVNNGVVDVRLVAKGNNIDKINNNLNNAIEMIKDKISDYIYSYDNEDIEEVVFKILKHKNLKVAFCESCTGGLISSRFTRIPGASEVFDRGIVTYSIKSKIEELNVKEETIKKYGAVSEQTALEMAKGLIDKTGVDIGLSITGLAGPTNGNEEKPIGLVYIGIATRNNSIVIKSTFTGNRISVQNKAALKAFNELRKFLLRN